MKEEVKNVNEADMSGIKNAKPAKKTKVKHDPHMKVMAPQIEKEELLQKQRINQERVQVRKMLATIRSSLVILYGHLHMHQVLL